MNDVTLWFAVAFGLLVVELMTGTFYLLMVAIGCAVGGLAALAGTAVPAQLAIGAAVGIAATMLLRRTRWGIHRLAGGDAGANPDVILDIGEIVDVQSWDNGTAHVRYRGCRWDAALEPGASPRTGAQIIKAVRGSTLVVAPVPLNA
jgi:membrane protein implicated in regulation of membrane protease activity